MHYFFIYIFIFILSKLKNTGIVNYLITILNLNGGNLTMTKY